MALYVAATCLSSLLSSERIIRVICALSLATFVGAHLIHVATLMSVWCFFAAVLSFMVYLTSNRSDLWRRLAQRNGFAIACIALRPEPNRAMVSRCLRSSLYGR